MEIFKKNTYAFIFTTLVGASFVMWAIILFWKGMDSDQFGIFFLQTDNLFADFLNICGYASERDVYNNVVNGMQEKAYPPITYMLSYIFSRIVNYEETAYTQTYCQTRFLIIFVLALVILIVLLYTLILYYLNGNIAYRLATALLIVSSGIMLFTLERCNIILLAEIFILFYLFNYNNENNISLNQNNKFQRKNNMIKSKNSQIKSINTNNYIINTFNLSEKNYINNNTQTQKSPQRTLTEEISKFRKEKEELKLINQKHSKLIEKLIEDNKNLSDKVNLILEENTKLKQKIKTYKENQEQLVMLVKIIQKNGVDIEQVIDKWNNDVAEEEEYEKEDKLEEITSKSLALDSLNELNEKIDCSSFIPITMKDKKYEKKLKVTGVPKLNFDIIKKNQQVKRNPKDKKYNRKKKEKDNFLNKSK